MKDLKTNLLRYNQREDLKHEIEKAQEHLQHAKQEDKGTILAGIKRNQRQLEANSPVPLTPKEKDTLAALEKKLRTRITTNMPTQEVMRKNPAGAVDWHQRWEKINKPLIRMWKNAVIQLNPDNSDRDLANLERYRPSGAVDRFRSDAQITGVMSYHDIPDEQWPLDPPQTTALVQAQKRYDEEEATNEVNSALDKLDEEEVADETLAKVSPEQHAVLAERLQKAREALAKKRADEKQLNAALEGKPVEATVVI